MRCDHPYIVRVSKHEAKCTRCGKVFAPRPTWCEVILTLALVVALALAAATV